MQTFVDTASTATNRLDCTPVTPAAQALGSCYDQSGNMIQDIPNGVTPPHSYTYDAEGRLSGITDEGVEFYYDGEGRRVEIAGGGNPRSYLLDELGNYFVAFPANARSQFELQVYDHGMYYGSGGYPNHYTYTDPLNTARFILDAGTNAIVTCKSMPFGDALNCANDGSGDNVHFTGKERDTESGLDYFGARYYASSMGRFMSPDYSDDPMPIPFTDPGNPQTLNAYTYGINNPLSNADGSGHDVNVCPNDSNGNQHCTLMSNDQYSAATQGNGSLDVPSLNSVGMNGSGNITDADGNTVGTATYVSNGGFDYYGNQSFYNTLGTTGATMNNWKTYAGWYGASAAGALGAYAGGLTAMGGVEANSVVGPAALRNILAKVTDQGLRNIVGDLYRVTARLEMEERLMRSHIRRRPES